MTTSTSVVAVVPTYRPDDALVGNVALIRSQVDRVIVVDDGSGPAAELVLRRVAELGVELLRLPENGGIARALNAGVGAALQDAATRYLLTVDQDTALAPDFVARCLETFRLPGEDGQDVGAVVPLVVSGRAIRTVVSSTGWETPLEPVQSGMVIARQTFERVGLFREEFVIDCVDSDFFLRSREAGLSTAVSPAATMRHQLGVTRTTTPGRPGFAYHSPVRRFYMTRNRLTVLREHSSFDRVWFRKILMAELVGLALCVVAGPHRFRQLRAVAAGVAASIRGEFGPIPEKIRRRLQPEPH